MPDKRGDQDGGAGQHGERHAPEERAETADQTQLIKAHDPEDGAPGEQERELEKHISDGNSQAEECKERGVAMAEVVAQQHREQSERERELVEHAHGARGQGRAYAGGAGWRLDAGLGVIASRGPLPLRR